MSTSETNEPTPAIPPDEIAAATQVLAAESELPAMASRFLAKVQSWATPNLVLCVAKDDDAEAGWRLIPELTSGTVPAGAERSLAKLFDETPPESLKSPLRVRPADDIPGFKVRDTWIVPWSNGSASGFLVLRGIPRPHAANLGDAVAQLSQPLWPKLSAVGGGSGQAVDTARLEAAIGAAQRVVERLAAELKQGLDTLRAAAPAAAAPPPALEVELETAHRRVATLEEEQRALDEKRRAADERATAAERKAEAAEQAVKAAEDRARAAEDKLKAVDERASAAEAQVKALEERAQLAEARVQGAVEQARAADESAKKNEERARAAEEKAAAADKSRSDAETEREFARGEAADLKTRIAALERQLEDRGVHHADLEEARRQVAAAVEKAEAADKARIAAEADRDAAKVQTNQVWASLESLQRQVEADRSGGAAERAARDQALHDATAAKAAAERERDEAKAAFAASLERVKQAEAQERHLQDRWEKTSGAFASALEALRRTPFVPPTLRVSLAEAERFLENQEARAAAKIGRVLFLDRDMAALERLAVDLEVAGVDVLIAHYPEEVTFFIKTPDARGLSAVVCDVMAFRSDQNLSELFKSWRQDLPSLGLYLTFKADNPTEAEKAQRIPSVLTAGYLPRPLQKESLIEAFHQLGKRGKR